MCNETGKSLYQLIFPLLLILVCLTTVQAQKNTLPADTSFVSSDEVTVNGKRIRYQVTKPSQLTIV